MARTTIQVTAPPEAVFSVLADAGSYDEWVVGCKEIRAADAHWPEPGSSFHHTVGIGPLDVSDSTSVTELDAPRRLVLRARARPTGVARVEFDIAAVDGGAEVTITERPVEGPPAWLHNPVQDWLIDRRNRETLRRLKRLAEQRR